MNKVVPLNFNFLIDKTYTLTKLKELVKVSDWEKKCLWIFKRCVQIEKLAYVTHFFLEHGLQFQLNNLFKLACDTPKNDSNITLLWRTGAKFNFSTYGCKHRRDSAKLAMVRVSNSYRQSIYAFLICSKRVFSRDMRSKIAKMIWDARFDDWSIFYEQ